MRKKKRGKKTSVLINVSARSHTEVKLVRQYSGSIAKKKLEHFRPSGVEVASRMFYGVAS